MNRLFFALTFGIALAQHVSVLNPGAAVPPTLQAGFRGTFGRGAIRVRRGHLASIRSATTRHSVVRNIKFRSLRCTSRMLGSTRASVGTTRFAATLRACFGAFGNQVHTSGVQFWKTACTNSCAEVESELVPGIRGERARVRGTDNSSNGWTSCSRPQSFLSSSQPQLP